MTRKILAAVSSYYSGRLAQYGSTPKGVDWKDKDSQLIRFAQLHKLFDHEPDASVVDLGCGYGAFLEFLRARGHRGAYCGLDVSESMVEAAKKRQPDSPNFRFVVGSMPPTPADFVVSSGIFNVRLDISTGEWEDYIKITLGLMNKVGRKGLAFNCLTSYSDPEYMRDDLYYGNPCYWFDYCKRHYSQNVSLHHDYDLYEFTIILRK